MITYEVNRAELELVVKKLGDMKRIGCPDLLVLFTNTMSHKMLFTILSETKGQDIKVARCQSSSMSALRNVLDTHVEGAC